VNPVRYHAHRLLNLVLFPGVRDRKDLLAMHALSALSQSYLPWSHGAMRPSAVLTVLNDVMVNGRRRVVELGGGVSTFYLARMLRRTGGRLVTVEHDEDWVGLLDKQLREEGLADVVTVIHAPLAPSAHAWSGDSGGWYDEDRLAEVRAAGDIDLLLVDGPPAVPPASRHARYPALPFFAEALAVDHTVVLDDIDRRGEQEIVRRWQAEHGLAFDRRFIHGTIAIGRSGRRLIT
jgi:predicted O-methyltransferase YrrM